MIAAALRVGPVECKWRPPHPAAPGDPLGVGFCDVPKLFEFMVFPVGNPLAEPPWNCEGHVIVALPRFGCASLWLEDGTVFSGRGLAEKFGIEYRWMEFFHSSFLDDWACLFNMISKHLTPVRRITLT